MRMQGACESCKLCAKRRSRRSRSVVVIIHISHCHQPDSGILKSLTLSDTSIPVFRRHACACAASIWFDVSFFFGRIQCTNIFDSGSLVSAALILSVVLFTRLWTPPSTHRMQFYANLIKYYLLSRWSAHSIWPSLSLFRLFFVLYVSLCTHSRSRMHRTHTHHLERNKKKKRRFQEMHQCIGVHWLNASRALTYVSHHRIMCASD